MSKAALLERDVELAALDDAITLAGQGSGSLVVVEGPAGIGKTRLLAEAVDRARSTGLRVARARGGEIERRMPFGVARELFEPLVERTAADARSRLLSGSARFALAALGRQGADGAAPAFDPIAPIHGLYWLLANLAETEPVALAVDDVHWSDPQTLRFLVYSASRLEDLAALVLVAIRSGEPDEPEELEDLRLHAVSLRPRALSPDAVRGVIAEQLDAGPAPEFVAACVHATAGNPFLVAEVLRALREEGVAPAAEAAPAIGAVGLESVARYVLARLERFDSEATALARAIAVLGGSPQLRHAARLAAVAEDSATALCDRLREAEILTEGLPLDFVHPLIRQAIYSDIPGGERSRLHRRAAQVLAETDAEARALAPHLIACMPNGDQWVVERLGEAAWAAIAAGAFDSGQAYLERALAEPPDYEEPIRYALGRCMLQTDPVAAADSLVDLAEGTGDPKLKERSLRFASQGYSVVGDWAKAARCHLGELEVIPAGDRERRLVSEAQLFVFRSTAIGRDRATSERIRAVAAGLTGASPGECLVLQALSIDRFMDCAPVAEIVALAKTEPPAGWAIRTIVPLAAHRLLARSGHWDDARRATAQTADTARELGLVVNWSYYSSILSEVERAAGRLVESEAEARSALAIAGEAALGLNPGREARSNLVATLVARGEGEDAERITAAEDFSEGPAEVPLSPWPLEVRGYTRLARGDLAGGAEDLLRFGEQAESLRMFNPAMAAWRQEAAPALAALGRAALAEELIAVAEARARAFGAAHVIGTVLRARALISARQRQIELLRESVAALEVYGPPHELAGSLLELGAALRRNGQRADARPPLRRAQELARRSGAGGIERRARDELAATGARRLAHPLSGREALTATEQRIAAMAAEGKSNPEIAQALFVTRKNVENHLGRIYTKLGINSRTRLAAALGEDGSADRR